MNRLHEKAQGHTKQIVGQMIGDDQLMLEGERQVREAEDEHSTPRHSDHGIVKDKQAEEQPKDKERAETVHETGSDNSVSKEQTR